MDAQSLMLLLNGGAPFVHTPTPLPAPSMQPEVSPPDPSSLGISSPAPNLPAPTPPTPKYTGGFMSAMNSQPSVINNPSLTKGGKLIALLLRGAQGAMAGRAAEEQAIQQSGGHRSAGVGEGFQAGMVAPFQRQMIQNQLAQQEAQTELTRQQAQNIYVPGYGSMPAGLAKVLFPAQIRGQATLGAAQTRAGATTEAAQIRGEASRDVARINQGQGIPVDADTARLIGMPELAGQAVGRGTWTNINKNLEAQGLRVQDMGQNGTDQNSGMWLMNRNGTRIRQVSPNSLTFQRGASFAQNRPEVVVDPNDPGYQYFTTAAEAMRNNLPAPGGAAPTAAKRAAVSEVPTKIGDQRVAFNTAIQHASLLRQAAAALSNGDVQALNGLQNQWRNAFGDPRPITAQSIADAYGDEVTKMLTGGHLTDKDMGKTAKTIDPLHQNYKTVDSVLSAYQNLAQSKLNMLNNQERSATAPRGPKANNQSKLSVGQMVTIRGKQMRVTAVHPDGSFDAQ